MKAYIDTFKQYRLTLDLTEQERILLRASLDGLLDQAVLTENATTVVATVAQVLEVNEPASE